MSRRVEPQQVRHTASTLIPKAFIPDTALPDQVESSTTTPASRGRKPSEFTVTDRRGVRSGAGKVHLVTYVRNRIANP